MTQRWTLSIVVFVPLITAGCSFKAGFQSGAAPPPPPQPVEATPVAVAPPASAPPAMSSGAIEAGCSFTGTQLRGEVGAVFQVACPANCQDDRGVWGTDVYTLDSAICRAGIHAGLVTSSGGGVVTVRLEPGRPAYRGSVRNGVRSSDYGNYHESYAIMYPQGRAPMAVAPAAGPQVVEAGCSFTGNDLRVENGAVSRVSCPPGCADKGGLWGSDVYTGDSAVCRAGIHAGLISPNGGALTVVMEGGRPAFRGSVRNGIRSSDYGSYGTSYHVQR
ncbi:MAG TPA: LCCL domain-containing protein [Polyangiaceae bacterium]